VQEYDTPLPYLITVSEVVTHYRFIVHHKSYIAKRGEKPRAQTTSLPLIERRERLNTLSDWTFHKI
jgi:hypothetical protein